MKIIIIRSFKVAEEDIFGSPFVLSFATRPGYSFLEKNGPRQNQIAAPSFGIYLSISVSIE